MIITRNTALAWLHRYGTPLTVGLFLVSAISGVALFFRWAPQAFHSMHEWLSLVLLAPFAVHMWKNWRPLIGYFRRRTLTIPLALSLVVALPFAVNGLTATRTGSPAFRVVRLMTAAPLTTLAPVLKTTPERLQAALQDRGFTVASISDRFDTIVASGSIPPERVLFDLLPAR